MKQRLTWVSNGFIDKNTYAPFVVNSDAQYYDDLCKRYNQFLKNAVNANADEESIKIIKHYANKVRESIREYYKGKISTAHTIIKNLAKGCIGHELAVNTIVNSDAFPGVKGTEIQLYRARLNQDGLPFEPKDMLHMPFKLRGKTGNYRFSIPGVPSVYLGNSSYACWIELGRPAEHDFAVSPVLLDGTQRILNLAVMNRDLHCLNDLEENAVHCWLKLLVLMIATSYRIKETDRIFKSEYIVSQSIMLACKELGIDGVAYYSKRVEDQMFAQAAINVALCAIYEKGKEYSRACEHMKVGRSFNYSVFKQLGYSNTYKTYNLRCLKTGIPNNIGSYERQFEYSSTEFCRFDQFLFEVWKKDDIDFGNALKNG